MMRVAIAKRRTRLSISRQLIELMHGTLYVSSQPMVGTTFSFTLPLASEEEIAQARLTELPHFQAPEVLDTELPEQSNLPENEHGPLLLVADDEPVNLRVLDSFYVLKVIAYIPRKMAIKYLKQLNVKNLNWCYSTS